MTRLIVVAAVSATLLLAGCATDLEDAHAVEAMARRGQCDSADTYASRNISDLGLMAYEHAFVANVCRRNPTKMLGYLTLGARYGNADAQASLTRMGKPVPAADLQYAQRQAEDRRAATLLMLLNAGMSGYNQGRDREQSHAPVSTSCTTTSTGMVNCLSY